MSQGTGRPPTSNAMREPLLTKQLWVEAQLSKGLDTSTDPADIDDAELTDAKNVRIRFDKTGRRYGFIPFTPIDADQLVVLKLATLKLNNGKTYLIKLRAKGPRWTDLNSWFQPTGVELNGTSADRFSTAIAQNLFVFANNGVNFIQQLDVSAPPGTFGRLGNAPRAKYLTGFYNRIIAANYTDPLVGTPATLGWSGDTNPTQWDPLVDPSAGISPLLESPGDYADFISGVFGFTNVLIVMRERSIWMATKQPIGTDPFFFSATVSGIGSNCPDSIVIIPNGLIWVDTITGSVWAYELGNAPERIGLPIEKDLVKNITDPNLIFGSYSPANVEYTACIPIVGSRLVKCWTFNFRSKSWSYDEIEGVTDIDDSLALPRVISIDALLGTIDALTSSIDSLGSAAVISSTRLICIDDGPTIDELVGTINGLVGSIDNLSTIELNKEDTNTDTDNGVPYETIIASKDFNFPSLEYYVAEVKLEYIAYKSGTLILEYSKDGGITWTTKKSIITTEFGVPRYHRFVGQYKARRMRWRLRSLSGLYDVLEYEVHVFIGPESRIK